MLPKLPDIMWPTQNPGAVLDYTFNTFDDLFPISDSIASVAVSVQPSGDGELQIDSVSIAGYRVICIFSGGVAGRVYIVQLVVNTVALRTFPYEVGLPISPLLATPPYIPPPSPFFGTPVIVPPYFAINLTDSLTPSESLIFTDGPLISFAITDNLSISDTFTIPSS